jgi:hypothetical protein
MTLRDEPPPVLRIINAKLFEQRAHQTQIENVVTAVTAPGEALRESLRIEWRNSPPDKGD